LESKKKNVGNHAFFRDNESTMIQKSVKIQRMYGGFFPNFSSIIPEEIVVTPIFFLDSDS